MKRPSGEVWIELTLKVPEFFVDAVEVGFSY